MEMKELERIIDERSKAMVDSAKTEIEKTLGAGVPQAQIDEAVKKAVAEKLTRAGIRLELDDRNEKIGYKIREAQLEKVPYMFVIGEKEKEETVIREIKEEIGQDVEELQYIRSFPYLKKEMLMLGYKASVKKKEFKLSCEVDSVEWVKYEDALSKLREGSIAWQLVKTVIEEAVYK